MNKDVKEKWVKALRSGEYKQGCGVLHNSSENTFCCLGVLTDLYIKEHGGEWEDTKHTDAMMFDGQPYYLPIPVQEWADVDRAHEVLVKEKGQRIRRPLPWLNDHELDFKGIADLIEEQL